ncbi:MAG TPA: hypothetical protein VK509_20775 [Polyangiales bacterium]|nr:hypothetical protein [Polyangiales bacterium]
MVSGAPAQLGRIKGAAFREFIAYYRTTYGAEGLAAVVTAMPPVHRRELDLRDAALGVLASEWYAAEVVHALLDEIARGKSEFALRELAAAASAAVMRATLRGLYRKLFEWMATPERYARYAPKLWGTYYDSGEVVVEFVPGELLATSTTRNWRSHHPLICELNRGASVEIYTAMGCRDVICDRAQCISRGDPHCRFLTRWRA